MSLIVQDLTKRYGDKVVVDHLSFRMDQPGVYALLGSNGAGKTTSIRMMLGILARDGGTVLWNDRPLNTDTCNVGYLAEERGLYPKYDLMDQLVYFASLRGVDRAEARKRIKYWAERLEVGEYLYPQMPKPAPEQALLGGKILAVMLYVAALLLLVLLGMGGSVLLAGLLFGPGTGAEALSAVLPYLTGAQ